MYCCAIARATAAGPRIRAVSRSRVKVCRHAFGIICSASLTNRLPRARRVATARALGCACVSNESARRPGVAAYRPLPADGVPRGIVLLHREGTDAFVLASSRSSGKQPAPGRLLRRWIDDGSPPLPLWMDAPRAAPGSRFAPCPAMPAPAPTSRRLSALPRHVAAGADAPVSCESSRRRPRSSPMRLSSRPSTRDR